MIKNIIREYEADSWDCDFYFDDDGIRPQGKFGTEEWNYCLFVLSWDSRCGFEDCINKDDAEAVERLAENIADAFGEVGGKWATYDNYKQAMEDYGIKYTPRKCHALKEWAKTAFCKSIEFPDDLAGFLSIVTGKEWCVSTATGYSQGDYAAAVYCKDYYKDGAKSYCEVALGCYKAFCVIDIEDGEETDSCYGYIVTDSEARKDEDYKRIVCEWVGIDEAETRLEMIDGYHTTTTCTYRVA